LFVDRLSYHFVRPKVGDGLVFRTVNIPYIEGVKVTDKFYIKRLVGVPGDVLEVREPVLYRNGKPIEGSIAFEKNARREGNYPGYVNTRRLSSGRTETIPAHSFYAMGDNSVDSSDSRVWGFVPEREVVGRPLFIYYPFTRRWGPAP
jgi:signal peptidase I